VGDNLSCRIGIDLGGTKIEGVALAADGTETARRRISAPRDDYDKTLAAIADLVADLSQTAACGAPIGVGIPGAISPATGLVKNANSTWLIGHPIRRDLEARLGRPVRLANDANCFALSEATDGATQGHHCVFGVILGTGVGAGLVVNGKLLLGPNAIAGEWGHNPLPWPDPTELPGPKCYCGKRGCIETFVSGPGLATDHLRVTGVELTAEAIVDGADESGHACKDTLHRYADRLAKSLAHVINIVDPDAIVVGGGLSNVAALYDLVPARWGRYVFSDEVSTPLLKARHGDSSGVRGAARLWA
jgi:fructokinase